MTAPVMPVDIVDSLLTNARSVGERLIFLAQPPLPDGIKRLEEFYGVDTVVSLWNGMVTEEQAACQASDINFLNFQIPGIEIITTPPADLVLSAKNTIEDPGNGVVATHCQFGKDRTSMLMALVLIDLYGWNAHDAIQQMFRYHDSWVEFGMRDFIEDYWEQKQKVGQ